jgi:hypothetical protein
MRTGNEAQQMVNVALGMERMTPKRPISGVKETCCTGFQKMNDRVERE